MTEAEAIDKWRKLQAVAAEGSGASDVERTAFRAAADRLLAKFSGTAEEWSRGRAGAPQAEKGPIGLSGWKMVQHDDLVVQVVAPDLSSVLLGWGEAFPLGTTCRGCAEPIGERAWKPLAYNGRFRLDRFCRKCVKAPRYQEPLYRDRAPEGYAAQIRRLHGVKPTVVEPAAPRSRLTDDDGTK